MPTPPNTKFFLSAVTREFGSYRSDLVRRLTRPNVDVKVQEDFVVTGETTLQKLDVYIQHCSAIVHLVGDATGAVPPASSVHSLLARYPDLPRVLPVLAEVLKQPEPGISYSQWEAYLAMYHNRQVFIYRPVEHAPRECTFQPDPVEQAAQALHYERICALGRDRGQFEDVKDLSSLVMRDLLDILANANSQTPTLAGKLQRLWKNLCGPIDRGIHALHCRIHPVHARPWNVAGGPSFWIAIALRLCAVVLTITVLWRFYFQIEEGSLHGIQQGIFLGVAFFVNLFLLGWNRIPRQWARLAQLASRQGLKTRPWKLAAETIDLILLPLELTCVIATIPITTERWLKNTKPDGRIGNMILLAVLMLAIVVVQVLRYWPFYRHACRSLFRGQPPALALAINWLLAAWFLFNPLLLPTGAVATFHSAGSEVLQVASDSATSELAVASYGENISSKFELATTIQIVDFPSLRYKPASFQSVPWEQKDLLQLIFHDQNITVMRGDILAPRYERQFLVWNRRETWGSPSAVPNLDNFQTTDIWLDTTGAVLIVGYKIVPGAAKSPTVRDMILNLDIEKKDQGENATTASHAIPAVAIASAPRQEIHWVNCPWLESLLSIDRVDRSSDGQFLVVTGTRESATESENPYFDSQTRTLAVLEIASGNFLWEQTRPQQSSALLSIQPGDELLGFSPDGQRILESSGSGLYTSSDSTTYTLLDSSTGDITSSFSADAGKIIWSPDSSHLALRCEQRIEIYDAVTTVHVKTYYVPRGNYTCHAFTHDGKYLAAGGDQGALWLYEVPAE